MGLSAKKSAITNQCRNYGAKGVIMKQPHKYRTLVCLFATALLSHPSSSLAQGPVARKSEPKPGGSTSAAADTQLNAIRARANAAATKVNAKDPNTVKRVNAELARVHSDFMAYAAANGLKVTSKDYSHKSQTGGGQTTAAQADSCPGTTSGGGMVCMLTSVEVHTGVFGTGPYVVCHYSCTPQPPQKK